MTVGACELIFSQQLRRKEYIALRDTNVQGEEPNIPILRLMSVRGSFIHRQMCCKSWIEI